MPNPIDTVWGLLSREIGVDLGTANTSVLVRGRGILLTEPSVVALEARGKRLIAVGAEAKRMIGRTPPNLVAVRPLRDGAISDFEVAEQLLRYIIEKVHERSATIPRPRVVIAISSGITEVQRRAVHDAAMNAGAREVWLIEHPMAGAVGAGLDVTAPAGCMIIDVGAGTTEVAVISLGSVIASRTIRVAGDAMDQDIVAHMRQRHNLLIGERTAEEAKITASANRAANQPVVIRGRDVLTGLPSEIHAPPGEIDEAIAGSVNTIVDAVIDTLEETAPELVADVMQAGLTLVGGGGFLPILVDRLRARTKVRVNVADDPMACVVRGAGRVLVEPATMRRFVVDINTRRVAVRG